MNGRLEGDSLFGADDDRIRILAPVAESAQVRMKLSSGRHAEARSVRRFIPGVTDYLGGSKMEDGTEERERDSLSVPKTDTGIVEGTSSGKTAKSVDDSESFEGALGAGTTGAFCWQNGPVQAGFGVGCSESESTTMS
jgi:hypothetical protein